MDFKQTLNLPRTSFQMQVKPNERELQILEFWNREDIYHKILEANKGRQSFILHDGPPFPNGEIHLGQALNKILKDIAIKCKTQCGYYCPFVPGWDTHGLPNEINAIKTFHLNRKETDPKELRKKCKELSLHFINVQREQFKRLGVFGEWEKPYLTLDPKYESAVMRIFAKMVEEGFIYKGLKPVYWCVSCETALAEAEIEYRNKKSPSIFLKFALSSSQLFPEFKGQLFILVWTTNPWTLAGNAAIAVHPHEIYCLVNINGEGLILAEPLLDYVMKQCNIEEYEVISSFPGTKLEETPLRHPFLNASSIVISEEYVTMDQGTGCVHIAPGLGIQDYESALKYNLPVTIPINGAGKLTEDAGFVSGMGFEQANEAIIERLAKEQMLLRQAEIEHSYPHCWRCRNPVIFRATEQWFMAVDVNNLRERCLEEIENVRWIPPWGIDRISNMLKDRPDWCISRQRDWGIPIPAFRCRKCKKHILDPVIIRHIADIFAIEGSSAWFEKDVKDLLPQGYKCRECGCDILEKEMEIFDVWFESGVSYQALCQLFPEFKLPADLFLEGSDQHRGWFQTSLLATMATSGQAPYLEVLTHGWVLDEEGRTMHKSLGNVISPDEIVAQYGADVLRLLAASVDCAQDIRIGPNILKQALAIYRKIRNTLRFMLGNIYDFSPDTDMVKDDELESLDRWILHRKEELIAGILEYYNQYAFHQVFHNIHNFCVRELSQIYLDLQKDILYSDKPDSKRRRSAQTAIYGVLRDITLALAPILPFIAEDVWQNCELFKSEQISAMLAQVEPIRRRYLSETGESYWGILLGLRSEVNEEIEELRKKEVVKQSTECRVKIWASGNVRKALEWDPSLLKVLLKTAEVEVAPEDAEIPKNARLSATFPRTAYMAEKFNGEKCRRCRRYFDKNLISVNGLCDRCKEALSVMPAS